MRRFVPLFAVAVVLPAVAADPPKKTDPLTEDELAKVSGGYIGETEKNRS